PCVPLSWRYVPSPLAPTFIREETCLALPSVSLERSASLSQSIAWRMGTGSIPARLRVNGIGRPVHFGPPGAKSEFFTVRREIMPRATEHRTSYVRSNTACRDEPWGMPRVVHLPVPRHRPYVDVILTVRPNLKVNRRGSCWIPGSWMC